MQMQHFFLAKMVQITIYIHRMVKLVKVAASILKTIVVLRPNRWKHTQTTARVLESPYDSSS